MQPVRVPNVPIYAGDYVAFPAYVITQDAVPENLSAYTNWRAQWRSTPDDEIELELLVDTAQVNVGRIQIGATPEITDAMGGSGWWDVQAENGPVVRTFVYGRTEWRKDVTRD